MVFYERFQLKGFDWEMFGVLDRGSSVEAKFGETIGTTTLKTTKTSGITNNFSIFKEL